MNEDLHQIDDLFKSGFEGKEETPSPTVWENIEKELDKKKNPVKHIDKQKNMQRLCEG